MSEYRIENLRTGDSEIFDTIDECRTYVGNDNYLNYAIYEILDDGNIVTELDQDILKKYIPTENEWYMNLDLNKPRP